METIPYILLTYNRRVTCVRPPGSGLRHLVLSNMGTQLDETAAGLDRLTERELEACVLHLADGWPQATVAGWLGVSRRGVQLLLASAAGKVPALRSLWARSAAAPPPRRPRVVHLSQLATADRAAFDADDL